MSTSNIAESKYCECMLIIVSFFHYPCPEQNEYIYSVLPFLGRIYHDFTSIVFLCSYPTYWRSRNQNTSWYLCYGSCV